MRSKNGRFLSIQMIRCSRVPLSACAGDYFVVATKFIISGSKRNDHRSNLAVGIVLVVVAVVLLSGFLAHGQVVFDKQTGIVTFDRTGLWFRTEHLSFPLRDVSHATVQPMGGGSYHFIVVFKGGGAEDIVASTSAGGQYKAAAAINEFLETRSD